MDLGTRFEFLDWEEFGELVGVVGNRRLGLIIISWEKEEFGWVFFSSFE